MLCVIRDEKVLREINLHAVAFSNGYRGEQVQEPVQNVRGRLREARGHALAVGIRWSQRQTETARIGPCLSQSSDCTDCYGRSENLQVVMVDLILEAGLTDLVQALELIEINRIPVRHDEPMENHSQAGLAEAFHPLGFAHDFRAGRN